MIGHSQDEQPPSAKKSKVPELPIEASVNRKNMAQHISTKSCVFYSQGSFTAMQTHSFPFTPFLRQRFRERKFNSPGDQAARRRGAPGARHSADQSDRWAWRVRRAPARARGSSLAGAAEPVVVELAIQARPAWMHREREARFPNLERRPNDRREA